MRKERAPRAGTPGAGRRRRRRRTAPRWLRTTAQLDALARSRCLMLLSVLSGELTVSEAIAQARISRAAYYQLETRGLKAMLSALNPLAASSPDRSVQMIKALQARVAELEQDKRRSQRLLHLSRKALWRRLSRPLPLGRPPKNALPGLMLSGKPRSWVSKAKAKTLAQASMPTKDGASGP